MYILYLFSSFMSALNCPLWFSTSLTFRFSFNARIDKYIDQQTYNLKSQYTNHSSILIHNLLPETTEQYNLYTWSIWTTSITKKKQNSKQMLSLNSFLRTGVINFLEQSDILTIWKQGQVSDTSQHIYTVL